MRRRDFVTLSGAVVATSLPGCMSVLGGSETHERTFETTTGELERPDELDTDAVDEDVFSTFVNSMRDDRGFGDAGFWGTAGDRPADGPGYLGALTETLRHENDVTSQHALAVYALDDAEERRHQCWLWSGYDVSDSDDSLSEMSVTFDAESDNVAVGVYAPRNGVDAESMDRYDLDIDGDDGSAGIATAFPLPSGSVDVDEDETEMGSSGSVRIRWSGTETDRYAMAMTCEAHWKPRGAWDLSWTVSGSFS